MKFRIGDKVIVTTGKDKGVKSEIVRVMPKSGKVVVKDVNKYTRHIKPAAGRDGERVSIERPLHTAKIAILNENDQADRIGYKVNTDGSKIRIFKKTGADVPTPAQPAEKK